MPERLEFYLQRRDEAVKLAEENPLSSESWLNIAAEWQKLHDALAREIGELPDQPEAHVLDT